MKMTSHSTLDGKGKQAKVSNSNSNSNGMSTPPSPRRAWIKLGGGRSRSVENMPPLASQQQQHSPGSTTPPLASATGSPGLPGGLITPASPLHQAHTCLKTLPYAQFLINTLLNSTKCRKKPLQATALENRCRNWSGN